jgi:hypothetical protein
MIKSGQIELPLIKQISRALLSLIIEISALTKESFSEDYEEIEKLLKNAKPKKLKQKIIHEQFLVEISFKIIIELWKAYFKSYYENKIEDHENAKLECLRNKEVFKELSKICKLGHLLVTLTVRNNKKALQTINELDLVDVLIEQIKTPWPLCLTDLFLIVNQNTDMKVLQKGGIKKLVDQLHQDVSKDVFNHKVLHLLTNICTPGGKADKKIQDHILEMVIGKNKVPDHYKNSKEIESNFAQLCVFHSFN